MIKFTTRAKDGRKLIGFGLSSENLRRLREKMPILVDLGELGVPGTAVLICWGETEDDIAADLLGSFGDGDTVVDDRRRR